LPRAPPRPRLSRSAVCQKQSVYASSFNLEKYFLHFIGTGAYSRSHRSGVTKPDAELIFDDSEKFNDTVALRFLRPADGSDPLVGDEFWSLETRELKRLAGQWPSTTMHTRPSKGLAKSYQARCAVPLEQRTSPVEPTTRAAHEDADAVAFEKKQMALMASGSADYVGRLYRRRLGHGCANGYGYGYGHGCARQTAPGTPDLPPSHILVALTGRTRVC
jgi:hypothetical protein